MKICSRAVNYLQLYNYEGDVRICGWLRDSHVGNLLEESLEDIWHGKRLNHIRDMLAKQDYSGCKVDACPWLARGIINEHLCEIEQLPEYPEELQLGFERICNYSCPSCSLHGCMEKCDWIKAEANAEKIEKQLRSIMPHLKRIGANGCGELFVSKHTLKLLADWRPLAKPEECEVILETNGSLFDAEHWSQIENIGQYRVVACVTIMSFNEKTYQILSGSKLPIEKIVDNLKFIKGLREKGIINFLELRTVVQERNFREMPTFTRRCLEEFGADLVTLRPYEPWHSKDEVTEWFTDVRGPEHPYHQEWKTVMSDPIFKHPKVADGSGGRDSEVGEYPFKKEVRYLKKKTKVLGALLLSDELDNYVRNFTEHEILVYGLGDIGKKVVQVLHKHGKRCYVLDRYSEVQEYDGARIVRPDELDVALRDRPVIVTTVISMDDVLCFLKKYGYTGELLDIQDIMDIH